VEVGPVATAPPEGHDDHEESDMTELQRFRNQIFRRSIKFTLIVVSALFVATLTTVGMKATTLLVNSIFHGNSTFGDKLVYWGHTVSVTTFVASILSDLLEQMKGTELDRIVRTLLSKLID
jgi:hypothetical protein